MPKHLFCPPRDGADMVRRATLFQAMGCIWQMVISPVTRLYSQTCLWVCQAGLAVDPVDFRTNQDAEEG